MSPTEVRVRETCKKCNGEKMLEHSAWQEFYSHANEEAMSDEDVRSWWAEQGFADPPPEEVPCYVCNGEGWIYKYVDVHDLARLIDGN